MTTRTENDLRAALTALENEAPDADAVLAAVRERTGRTAPRRGRWWMPGLVTGGVAVVAAAALLVNAVPDAGGPVPGVFRTGATGAVASVGPGRPVLLAAADTAAHAAPGAGRYWRTSADVGNVVRVGGAEPYLIAERGRVEAWSARASGDFSGYSQPLGVDLATAADRAAWRRDGSPTSWNGAAATGLADPEGYTDGGGTARTAPGARVNDTDAGGTPGKPFMVGPRALSPAGLRALPADPAKLRALLLQDWRRLRSAGDQTEASYLMETAPRILTMPVPPEVRAALYRMLAGLPDVRSLGTVRDVAGRRGAAIAVDAVHRQCGDGRPADGGAVGRVPWCTVQQRLVINPATGMPLAVELRYVKRPDGRWNAPGGLFSYQVYRAAGWTDAAPPK
ncbi:MAG TPA: CU044_5270 family protein [Streptosporangiaceae bacterium]|jgi:hypothetical protein